MSIAQQQVACEGDAHPNATAPSITAADSPALVEYDCDTTNLPWIIFRAAFRASHVDGLPSRARAVLAALARTVDAGRPFAAIYARRDLLTGRAMQSLRTFYRSLDDLETAGLIERQPQSRYEAVGRFGRSYLHLTEKAALLLGFIEPPAKSPDGPAQSTAEQRGLTSTTSGQHTYANLAHGPIYTNYLSPGSQKRQQGKPPADLERLRLLGFHDFLIFKLMRQASTQAKRLSDIVEATWEHLKKATHPIAYLRKLIDSPVDFAYQVRKKLHATAEVATATREDEHLRAILRASAGKTFIDEVGETEFRVSSDAQELVTVHLPTGTGGSLAARQLLRFAKEIAAGSIRQVEARVLPALAERATTPAIPNSQRQNSAAMMSDLKRMLRAQHFSRVLR